MTREKAIKRLDNLAREIAALREAFAEEWKEPSAGNDTQAFLLTGLQQPVNVTAVSGPRQFTRPRAVSRVREVQAPGLAVEMGKL